MKKPHSFLLAVALTLLIASTVILFSSVKKTETVIIGKVIDGDTVLLEDGRKIRFANINSPEKNTKYATLSINFIKQFENSTVEIEILGKDKYNRFLARIYTPSYLNLDLVKEGLASPFLVEESETKDFSKAEEYAIENSKGMWKKSDYYNCFSTDIDEEEEKVYIKSKCNTLNVNGFLLKDESTKNYIFKNINLTSIILHSGNGEDNATDIFWNSNGNVWNNDKDTLYIFDRQSNIIHYNRYGY